MPYDETIGENTMSCFFTKSAANLCSQVPGHRPRHVLREALQRSPRGSLSRAQAVFFLMLSLLPACHPSRLSFSPDPNTLVLSYRVDRQQRYVRDIMQELALFCPSRYGRIVEDTPWHPHELSTRRPRRPPPSSAAAVWQNKEVGAWYTTQFRCAPAPPLRPKT